MIEVRDLSKQFPGSPAPAVDGIRFTVRPGEVFGLLGPNGAGKTTTLRMLATLLVPDAGSATVNGHDVRAAPEAVRASIGYLSPSTGLYGRLTPREILIWFARLHGVADAAERAGALMARLEILPYADLRCDRLSTGQKQRVSIARTLVADPPVLILDEATTGLDVLVVREVLDEIRRAKNEGRCVIFSTHIMSQAEQICDRLAVLHRGRIAATGTLQSLREASGEHYLEDIFFKLVGSIQ